MVNSGSFDSDGRGDRNAKVGLTQPHDALEGAQSSSPVSASVATPCNAGLSRTADGGDSAFGPTPTKTEFNCDVQLVEDFSLCCSLPLEKIQGVLTSYRPPAGDETARTPKQPRKLLCLYCDRSFVSANLRQKHVERIHSVKQNRRVSSRRQNQLTVTPCVYCDKLNGTENTLKDLFQHLVNEHSGKYFGCLPCEERFLTSSLLADHDALSHLTDAPQSTKRTIPEDVAATTVQGEDIPVKITRSKVRPKSEEEDKTKKPVKKAAKLKELRSKKLSVKSSRIALKRRESKRLQAIAKLTDTQKKKRPRPVERKQSNSGKTEQIGSTKSTEKAKGNAICINPYPEFDNFFRVKKITDHSIDNLKISSLTFDDVFDKAFFNRIRCNIEENLLHHIDGKLFKNEESENRISNFEKISSVPPEIQNSSSENYGCELSLNAVTPVAALSLNSQFGEDFESQIEYGAKPSKKKAQPRKDEVHYKYFTRRKYQASILEHKENRDLSKLDMWTQLVIKKRQQKMLDDKKSAKEMLEYTSCDEYKNKVKREELNRILDRRGPFEDLKEEASKKAALDKLNSSSEVGVTEEAFTEVREVLNEILNRVFEVTDVHIDPDLEKVSIGMGRKEDQREIPGYLNLRRSSSLPVDGEIDRSDKIALICSSQETENFELPTNQVRGRNELIELTGEWARCRMYICAACGAKLPNMRYLLDHKSLYHQQVWVQHYEFVGNQSELYRHLSIPALGKVGAVEGSVQCKTWRRSDARLCTKCGKQCNSLGELHRHILECGGDWTWMLARKKCKYRPFGAKSRRKRRGLIHRVHNKQKTEPTEKKTYKKTFEGPRQRPSDADTIQRMLANLPAKRSTRKLISLQEGVYRSRKTSQNVKQNKVKCGKVIYKSSAPKETTEKTVNTVPAISKSQNSSSSSRRSLRNLNKVLASRILDSNTNLNVKRKIKVLNERRRTRQSQVKQENTKEIINDENIEQISLTADSHSKDLKEEDTNRDDVEPATKRSSSRSSPKTLKKKMTVKKLLTGKISIKSFFPVKKKNRKILTENQNPQDANNTDGEKIDIQTRSKRKLREPCNIQEEKKNEAEVVLTEKKKPKHETFSTLVRSLSLRRRKLAKKSAQDKKKGITANGINMKRQNQVSEKSFLKLQSDQELDKTIKKRKLKSSFRSVINKVKKLKIDNVPETVVKTEDVKSNLKTLEDSAFLEESNPEGTSTPVQVDKVVIPSISEVKENTADISTAAPIAPINFQEANEDPPIPETIFKLELSNEKSLQAKGELDFDTQPAHTIVNSTGSDSSLQKDPKNTESSSIFEKSDKTEPISIETSVKPKVVPLISPNMKGKIRKPSRGLNDCIAMLTSKLQLKTVEEEKKSSKLDDIFNIVPPNKAHVPLRENYPPKTECILRIPTYRSQMSYSEVEETALDLSTKSLRNKEGKEVEEPIVKLHTELFVPNVNYKESQFNYQNFVVPTFERKLTKTFNLNSIDRIIEEVVENRIQTIVPVIRQRKWNSVDDIIQKVIDDQHFKSHFPIKSSVDCIIDFVVESAGTENVGHKLDEKSNEVDKETSARKIGSIRKPKNKKYCFENEKPEVPYAGTILKEPLETAITNLDAYTIHSTVGDVIDSEPLKRNSKLKKTTNPPQPELKTTVTELSTSPSPIKTFTENIKDANKANEELDNPKENNVENIVPIPTKHIESPLNQAFIDSSCSAKTKKSSRKMGQVRNRSRVKKGSSTNTTEVTQKILIETDVDALLDVKEVQSNPLLEGSLSVCIDNENILKKSEEIKQISNEDEPHLLENKPMVLPQKPSIMASDSEDDVPLAALVKSDEKGVCVSGQPTCKKGNCVDAVSDNQKTVSKINGEHTDDSVLLEKEIMDLNGINSKNNFGVKEKNEEESTIHEKLPCDKIYVSREKEHTINDDGTRPAVETKANESECINEHTIDENNDNNRENRKQELSLPKEISESKANKPEEIAKSVKNSDDQYNEKIINSQDKNGLKSSINHLEPAKSKKKAKKPLEIEKQLNKITKKQNIKPLKQINKKSTTSKGSMEDKSIELLGNNLEETSVDVLEFFSDPKKTPDTPNKIDEPDGNNSKLISLLETNKSVENISGECHLNDAAEPKTTAKVDISSDTFLDQITFSSITSGTDAKDIISTKILADSDTTVPSLKENSENISNITLVEDKPEQPILELKPILVELSPKVKIKTINPKGKSKPIKSKRQISSCGTSGDATTGSNSKATFEEKSNLTESEDASSSGTIINEKYKLKYDTGGLGLDSKAIDRISTNHTKEFSMIEKVEANKVQKEKSEKSSIGNTEEELKTTCSDVCEGILALKDSKNTDIEIENILCSSSDLQPPQSTKSPNSNSYINESFADVPEQIKDTRNNKEKVIPKKPKRKSSKTLKNNNSNLVDVIQEANEYRCDKTSEENDNFNNLSSEITKITDVTLPKRPDVEVVTRKTSKQLQPVLRNLEITLELTDITKSIFSLSKGKQDLFKKENDKPSNSKFYSIKPDLKIKKKRQLRSAYKDPVKKNDDDNKVAENNLGLENRERKNVVRYGSSIRSRSLKNNKASSSMATLEDLLTTLGDKDGLLNSTEELPENILKEKSKEMEEKNEDLRDTSKEMNGWSTLEVISENSRKQDTSEGIIKRKGKHTSRSIKTSKKKNKANRIFDNQGIVDVNNADKTSNMRLIPEETCKSSIETNDILESSIQNQCDDTINEHIPSKVSEEPPIKIIINKQKTRRKSKSFKKIDLKGHNDLFEDFALVIKKPKRLTPIIAFTPTDNFSKETYSSHTKSPIQEPLNPTTVNESKEDREDVFVELDSSVEEMDMELDEIPITTSIIERDSNSFLSCTATEFAKTDGESINDMQNMDTHIKDNSKLLPIEELLLSTEKNLVLPTEADVEEFLCEANGISTTSKIRNTEIESHSEKCDIDFINEKEAVGDSFETTHNVTEFGFNSVNLNGEYEGTALAFSESNNESDNGSGIKTITNSISDIKGDEIKLGSVKTSNKKSKKLKNKKKDKIKSVDIGIKSKSTSIKISQHIDISLNNFNKKSIKPKDINSIYAFSESEDFEIEKPIEKPKRQQKLKTKSLSESVHLTKDEPTRTDIITAPVCEFTNEFRTDTKPEDEKQEGKEEGQKLCPNKKRSRSLNISSESNLTGEIKENEVEIQEERRKSIRSAKVKALEYIHDDALAELTESERNRDLEKSKDKIIENVDAAEELSKKRNSRRQSRSQKTFEEIKLAENSEPASNSVLIGPLLDIQDENPLDENIDESVKTINSDKIDGVACVESDLNEIISDVIGDKLPESTKKKSIKKINNKAVKVKKSRDTFHLAAEETEKSVLLNEIVSDLTGLEELENSIEKELGADPEVENVLKQLKDKTEQFEIKMDELFAEKIEYNAEENNQELRRSRRGSRKIASYNENDLIDPLLDEIDGKKKIRKKEKTTVPEQFESKTQKKSKDNEKKLNADELFDMLRASSNENNSTQKSQDNNKESTVKDFNGPTFEKAFEILHDQSPVFLNPKNEKYVHSQSIDNINKFANNPENPELITTSAAELDIASEESKKVSRTEQSGANAEENYDVNSANNLKILNDKSIIPPGPDIHELSIESKTKSSKSNKIEPRDKTNYCEICKKKFTRSESLIKHKRTLTHIQKLSEIEAKEAAQKSNSDAKDSISIIDITSDSSKVTESLSKGEIDIHDILQSEKPNRQEPVSDPTPFTNSHSLKLADIINDVLNKPVLQGDSEKHSSFSDIIMQNNSDVQPEYRRYKSLGERKSFDSEPVENRQVPISEPYISKTTILEKQISLLENIIENQTGVNYIDDISMSSNNSLQNNDLVSPSELSMKQDDSNYSRNLTKPNANDDSFLKPSQYEEISEDSVNLRSYEDQKLRKTLNRDEELFLECCSLLKSGSEMSSYSNKKSPNKVLSTMGLKQCDEPEWLERKSLVEKPLYDIGNEYSDNSRIPTPLGDSYEDDASNSNTISFNWNMTKKINVFEDISQDKEDNENKSFSFQEILNEGEIQDKVDSGVSKFGNIISKTIAALPKMIKRTGTAGNNCLDENLEKKQDDLSDGSTSEGKKIITKGARKVFEGLKVSIPTEELNLEEVLNFSPKPKKIDIANIQNSLSDVKTGDEQLKPLRNARKSKPVKNKSQFGSKLLFKMKKKKVTSPTSTKKKGEDVKTHDIYDFEETQDNTDIFTKPDFRAFRNMKSSETVPEPGSDTDSRDYVESFSYEVTSSISSSSSKKPKTQENITKKKCMIMGRIFKNAAKSKIEDIDEEIRDIPALDNGELVENYVANCEEIVKNEEMAKPKLTEKEIDLLFDQLLEVRPAQETKNAELKTCVKSKVEVKKCENKKRVKPKNKKRTRTNSESTDDEFSLNRNNKKRAYRKKAEDNCINLEQELKECIGVASRKSQRKCTSGKQNVLVEYWSSDESQFEALLESQRLEAKQPNAAPEANTNTLDSEEVLQESAEVSGEINILQLETVLDCNKYKQKSIEKKHPQKRKPSVEKKPKLTAQSSEKVSDTITSNRRKRAAANPLYHWSSSSEDESQDLIEVKPIRDELEDDEDRPVQHGWIVGDSPKKLVTMLAQAKGKKTDVDCVKEQGKKRTNAVS